VATTPTRRPGRPRPGEPTLTREAILTAALALVDEQGIEALSMRKLAARLQVDPMSIYHHVPNKAALVSGLVRSVFAEMAPPLDEGDWPDRVCAWARAYRDVALAHPHLVLEIVTDAAAASGAAIQISEPLYAALAAAGLTPRAVLHAAGTLVDFVNGYALGASAPAGADPMGDHLAAMDPALVPTMRRIHEAVADGEPGGGFEAGLDIIVRGIAP